MKGMINSVHKNFSLNIIYINFVYIRMQTLFRWF